MCDFVIFRNPGCSAQILAGEVRSISEDACRVAVPSVAMNWETFWDIPPGDMYPAAAAWEEFEVFRKIREELQKPPTMAEGMAK